MPAYDSRFDPPAPLARVDLQNVDSGIVVSSVPMLIDSGADATMIPLSIAEQLNLPAGDKAFELEAFDGKKSVQHTVRAELQFLKRAFKGQYLTVDQEYGYLGRDIINQVSLLLDGPRSNWDKRK
ncbi:MAG TPA: retropepsin-like aspartic protease [Planctomycetota bacterium]|nr:retropepsin-like aspartic protease [Planctomycetota bacterium]